MLVFYDFEVFKYDWLVCMSTSSGIRQCIVNDKQTLESVYNARKNDIWIGANNKHYDQYILKSILCDIDPYETSQTIIRDKIPGWRISNVFRDIQMYNYDALTALDTDADDYKAGSKQGLKALEGMMGDSIKESSVPFALNRKLTDEELKEVIAYCWHDVNETEKVFQHRINDFKAHVELIKEFGLPKAAINKTKTQISATILGAQKIPFNNDEFNIEIVPTLQIDKYKHIVDWYKNPENHNYNSSLVTDVFGVSHTFAWGGVHGGRKNFIKTNGHFLIIDVDMNYPSIMLEYDMLSRAVKGSNIEKYKRICANKRALQAQKNPRYKVFKLVANATYGAAKDKYSTLYDPKRANDVCVNGQLLILDLLEHLEKTGACTEAQANTDGILIEYDGTDASEKTIVNTVSNWVCRTGMHVKADAVSDVWQKDVNNYIIRTPDGEIKTKGAYVKEINELSYNLLIVNKAVVAYFTAGVKPEDTIAKCNDLREYQNIVKISGKYSHAIRGNNPEPLREKCFRVFASKNQHDVGLYKVKKGTCFVTSKLAYVPEHCFIDNGDIHGKYLPPYLDKQWYVDLAWKRINDFIGKDKQNEQ